MERKRYYAVLFVMSGFFFSPFWIKLLAGEGLLRNEVLTYSRTVVFTNDLLFNTVLSVMNIRLEGLYEAENDLASPSYNADPARFRTLYGKKRVGE